MASETQVKFGRETYDEKAWSADIMLRHWQELGHSPELPLAPDFAMYALLDSADRLRIYTARIDDQLIGYAVFLLSPDLFIKDKIQASCNLLFLESDYRRGWLGYNLMKFANEQLVLDGVSAIWHCLSNRNHGLSILLERMGFRKMEELWLLPVRAS